MLKTTVSLLVLAMGVSAMAVDIRSLNNGRGDIATHFEYDAYRTDLASIGYTIHAGVSTVSAANLSGMEAFHVNVPNFALSGAEQTDLFDWVSGGGLLIVEGDSSASNSALNSYSQALGLGSIFTGSSGGGNSTTAGTFSNNVSRTTVGVHGDLRGLSYGSSITTGIDATGGIVVGTNSVVGFAEFSVGSGHVLFAGDPSSIDLFMMSGDTYYNPNNSLAYKNYLDPVPEPATMVVLGGLAALAARRKRK